MWANCDGETRVFATHTQDTFDKWFEVKPETLWYFILLLIFKDIDEIGHYLTMTEHDKAQNVYKFQSCTDLDETEIHVMFWR